jgi:hypothetical protein
MQQAPPGSANKNGYKSLVNGYLSDDHAEDAHQPSEGRAGYAA